MSILFPVFLHKRFLPPLLLLDDPCFTSWWIWADSANCFSCPWQSLLEQTGRKNLHLSWEVTLCAATYLESLVKATFEQPIKVSAHDGGKSLPSKLLDAYSQLLNWLIHTLHLMVKFKPPNSSLSASLKCFLSAFTAHANVLQSQLGNISGPAELVRLVRPWPYRS